MPTAKQVWDPAKHLQIQDIALWETELKRFVEYQPGIHDENISVLSRRQVRVDLLEASDHSGHSADLLRALVTIGIRAMHVSPDAIDEVDPDDDDRAVYELEATFAATYLVLDMPSDDDVSEFANWNSVHNVWPFWRQHVYDTLKKASLPLISIPFFSGRPKLSDSVED